MELECHALKLTPPPETGSGDSDHVFPQLTGFCHTDQGAARVRKASIREPAAGGRRVTFSKPFGVSGTASADYKKRSNDYSA